jgi:hypothetical protein
MTERMLPPWSVTVSFKNLFSIVYSMFFPLFCFLFGVSVPAAECGALRLDPSTTLRMTRTERACGAKQ